MATDRELSIRLHAINNLLPGLGSAEKSIKLFVGKSTSHFKGLKMAAAAAVGITAAAMFAMGKRVVDLDAKMVRLKINSGLSSKEMLQFKDQILNTGIATGNTGDDMADLATAALHGSNNIDFVKNNLVLLAKVMNATGASAEDVGNSMGEAFKKAGMSSEEFKTMMETLYSVSQATGREQSLKEFFPSMPKMIETFKVLHPQASLKEITDYLAQGIFSDNPEALNKAMGKMMMGVDLNVVKNKLGIKGTSFEEIMGGLNKKAPGNSQDAVNKRLRLMKELFGKGAIEVAKLYDNWDKLRRALQSPDMEKLNRASEEKKNSISGQMASLGAAFDKISGVIMGPALAAFFEEIKKAGKDVDVQALIDEFVVLGKALADTIGYLAALPGNLEKVGAAISRFVGNQDYKDLVRGREKFGYGPMEIIDPNALKMPEAKPINASIPGAPTQISVVAQFPGLPAVEAKTVTARKTGSQMTIGSWDVVPNPLNFKPAGF